MKKIILLVSPLSLFAAVASNNQAMQIIDTFQNAALKWNDVIIPAAMFVFWSLVAIDFVLTFGFMAIKGADFGELFYELIRKVIIIGFFLFLFATAHLMSSIPSSFAQLANEATHLNIRPDTIIELGFDIVHSMWHGLGFTISSLGVLFGGFIIMIAFSIMAAHLFITTVKLFLLMSGAYLVYALGGLTQTRSYAINPIISIIKAGMELFFIKLILGLSVNTVRTMGNTVSGDNFSVLAMIAVAILLVSLVQMVPGLVESLVSGHFAGNSTAGLGIAKAAVAGAIGGLIGGGAAIKAASNLSKSGGGSTLGNLAKAAGADALRTITGSNRHTAGNMGARMAGEMKGKSDVASAGKSGGGSAGKSGGGMSGSAKSGGGNSSYQSGVSSSALNKGKG